jgi:D-glutamate cyclase
MFLGPGFIRRTDGGKKVVWAGISPAIRLRWNDPLSSAFSSGHNENVPPWPIPCPVNSDLLAEFETAIRRDPARRGLIASEPEFGPLCSGHLAAAARNLAEHGRRVAIATGFYIPAGDPPAAETDGPSGALVLAQTLEGLGIKTMIVTDGYCFSALETAARHSGYPADQLVEYRYDVRSTEPDEAAARWRAEFLAGESDRRFTHLIAIERVGPSHTLDSVTHQSRTGSVPLERFTERVPPHSRNVCHNMRGENIDQFAGDLHRLFEEVAGLDPSVTTIGIGDGANEIGMGAVPWEDLERRLTGEQAGRVPCRVAADWNIVAGTSNWGGYALAAAVALLRDRISAVAPFDCRQQQDLLAAMVAGGPAVDGVTRRREPTVDGLPFLTYIQPWQAIRSKLGLSD